MTRPNKGLQRTAAGASLPPVAAEAVSLGSASTPRVNRNAS
jgi:hypothetical protein